MDSNLKIFLNEFENMKGQFVITESWRIERFVAIAQDDMDYYYITYDGRKFNWNTCVGQLVPLKGKVDDKYYNEWIRIAKINHFDQPDLWMPKGNEQKQKIILMAEQHKLELSNLTKPDEFLTQICWDLN